MSTRTASLINHSNQPRNDQEVQAWLADVRALTDIRHENVVLYMGACVEPPKFAIITSPIKVKSYFLSYMYFSESQGQG